ncbi:MAG: MerR family transcriptional regulator, partial [Polaribacter sp.]
LPENEIHELGLLYLNYELVLRGNHTIYLGQSLPLNNLNYFFKNHNTICFITSLTVQPYDDKIADYFNEIDTILASTKHEFIAIGRKTALVQEKKFKSNINFYKGISDLLKKL